MLIGVLATFGVLALAAATDIKTSKSNAVVNAETSADVTSERQGRVRRTLPTDEEMQVYLDTPQRLPQGTGRIQHERAGEFIHVHVHLHE